MNRVREVDFFIVETDSVTILGLDLKSCVDLEFIKLVTAIEVYYAGYDNRNPFSSKTGVQNVFEGIGLFLGECDICTDKTQLR